MAVTALPATAQLQRQDAEEAEDEAGDDEDAAGALGALLLDDLEEDDVHESARRDALQQGSYQIVL